VIFNIWKLSTLWLASRILSLVCHGNRQWIFAFFHLITIFFIDELKEHVTLIKGTCNPKYNKCSELRNVYCITCHDFYIVLRSFSKCLSRITELLWRLTFWIFYLARCDVHYRQLLGQWKENNLYSLKREMHTCWI